MHESKKFYDEFDPDLSLFKALLGVGSIFVCGVIFSMGNGSRGRIWGKFLILGLFAYQIWIMSYPILRSNSDQIKKSESLRSILIDLKSQIKTKEKQRDWFWEKGWVTRARKQDDALKPFYERAYQIERGLIDSGGGTWSEINAWAMVGFRVSMLMLGFQIGRGLGGFG